jgi:hypothetical protein
MHHGKELHGKAARTIPHRDVLADFAAEVPWSIELLARETVFVVLRAKT